MSEKELKGNTLPVVTASTEKKEVTVIRGAGNRQQKTTYNFDDVFSSHSTQVVHYFAIASGIRTRGMK
jgi:hypothetical protein